ncbi:MAG: MarR family transcriptional regulator [Deltaproteobacteria bacterium]|nr:MarR family transcriptional regulator [Deltaproteobacteria bacterium]MBW2053786.1 MarR family transcriptional regulator [Deltaproteobacteria bacterium]MBW2142435.1 MarR family transcriptional regulator [Deltaproteobacteria bacterium]MBW2324533.1 MarR family transcriptional regulator [Deltaproteobacteria bacterium]
MARNEYIGYLIARTHRVLKKRLTIFLSEYDLTMRQYSLLSILFEDDGLPARELVVKLFSDSSTIMDIIDRLEEKRLVRREADPQDRRVNSIFLTEKAKKMLPMIRSETDKYEQAIHRRLLPQEIEALKTGLTKLHRFASGQEESGSGKGGKNSS